MRNEHGGEENWLLTASVNSRRVVHWGKIVAAEVAFSLLAVTAAIETFAYGILFIGSLPVSLYSTKPLTCCVQMISTSGFTLFWNAGNALLFNPLYSNIHTHESFARLEMDHGVRGELLKSILTVTVTAFQILSIFAGGLRIQASGLTRMLNDPCMRTEDRLYIVDWYLQLIQNHRELRRLDPRAFRIVSAGSEINEQIAEGVTFFRDHILASGKIDAASREMVLQSDPEIYHFVLARAIYLYAFGALRREPIPSFFSASTQIGIVELREKKGAFLESCVTDHRNFEVGPQNGEHSEQFNRLKGVAYGEMQGIFIIRCWQLACRPTAANPRRT